MNVSHNLPPHLARSKALEAAERRARSDRVMSGAGRLGGGMSAGIRKGTSPRELAAQARSFLCGLNSHTFADIVTRSQAAERRARDATACGQGVLAQQEAARAAKDSAETKAEIDLTLEDDDIEIIDQPSSPTAGPSKIAVSRPTRSGTSAGFDTATRSGPVNNRGGGVTIAEWACPACTLLNEQRASRCSICLSPRPKPAVTNNEWPCQSCTFVNPSDASRCGMCENPRPSHSKATPSKASPSASTALKTPPRPVSLQPSPKDEEKWTCLACGEPDMPHDFWSCRFCGTVKLSS
jgi:DNA-dependent metalloprotease WSS1